MQTPDWGALEAVDGVRLSWCATRRVAPPALARCALAPTDSASDLTDRSNDRLLPRRALADVPRAIVPRPSLLFPL